MSTVGRLGSRGINGGLKMYAMIRDERAANMRLVDASQMPSLSARKSAALPGTQWGEHAASKSRFGFFAGRSGRSIAYVVEDAPRKNPWFTVEKISRNLSPEHADNLNRFTKKIPKNSENLRVKSLPNGGLVFQADSPAINIPGSYTIYEKQIDRSGKTLQYMKTTIGPDGEIVHIAPKFPPGPKYYPKDDLGYFPSFNPGGW